MCWDRSTTKQRSGRWHNIGIADSDTNSVPQNVDTGALCYVRRGSDSNSVPGIQVLKIVITWLHSSSVLMLLPWVLFPDNVVIWIWCLVLNSKTLWSSFGSDQNIIWFYDVNKHMNAHSPTNTSMHHAFHVDSNFNFPIPGSSAGQQETGSPRTSAASCVGIDQPRNKDREDDTTIGIAYSDTNSVPQNVDTSAVLFAVM